MTIVDTRSLEQLDGRVVATSRRANVQTAAAGRRASYPALYCF